MKLLSFIVALLILSFQMAGQSAPVVPADSLQLQVFDRVEVEASFTGGTEAWRRFLEKNLRGDTPVEHGAPNGRYTVIVQFIVDKEGNISDIRPLTHNGYGTEEEVLRVLKISGKWQPASQGGRFVKAYRKQPVTFIVETDGIDFNTAVPYQLYMGQDNRVVITAEKTAPENMEVTIPEGVLLPNADHSYTIHPVNPGRVIVTVRDKKKQKEIGQASFEVVKPK